MTSPRDVLAERISQWAGDSAVYDFADRLLKDLDTAGYEVVAREENEKLRRVIQFLHPEPLPDPLTTRMARDDLGVDGLRLFCEVIAEGGEG